MRSPISFRLLQALGELTTYLVGLEAAANEALNRNINETAIQAYDEALRRVRQGREREDSAIFALPACPQHLHTTYVRTGRCSCRHRQCLTS